MREWTRCGDDVAAVAQTEGARGAAIYAYVLLGDDGEPTVALAAEEWNGDRRWAGYDGCDYAPRPYQLPLEDYPRECLPEGQVPDGWQESEELRAWLDQAKAEMRERGRRYAQVEVPDTMAGILGRTWEERWALEAEGDDTEDWEPWDQWPDWADWDRVADMNAAGPGETRRLEACWHALEKRELRYWQLQAYPMSGGQMMLHAASAGTGYSSSRRLELRLIYRLGQPELLQHGRIGAAAPLEGYLWCSSAGSEQAREQLYRYRLDPVTVAAVTQRLMMNWGQEERERYYCGTPEELLARMVHHRSEVSWQIVMHYGLAAWDGRLDTAYDNHPGRRYCLCALRKRPEDACWCSQCQGGHCPTGWCDRYMVDGAGEAQDHQDAPQTQDADPEPPADWERILGLD